VLVDLEEFESALPLARQAIAASTALNDPWAVSLDEVNLTVALLRVEGPERALEHLADIAERALALEDLDLSISVVELLAMTVAELGEAALAARLIGTADAQREASGLLRTEPDEALLQSSLSAARGLVPPSDWTQAYAEGMLLSVESAAEGALRLRAREGSGA